MSAATGVAVIGYAARFGRRIEGWPRRRTARWLGARIYQHVSLVAQVSAVSGLGVTLRDPARGELDLIWEELVGEWLGVIVVVVDERGILPAIGRSRADAVHLPCL